MPTKAIMDENKGKMQKAVEYLAEELKGVRTGRASTGLVENIHIDYYGNLSPLKQVASLATPQADQILIKPFDPASIKDIERAIKNSDLSIAPIIEGKMIRLTIPPLSQERRSQFANQVKQIGEQAKVSIRNIRRDAIKHLEVAEKAKTITEDNLKDSKKSADEITKGFTDKVDLMIEAKSKEIMES